MSKGKQIDDLRGFLERVNGKDGISILGTVPLAEALYEAGYRKQNDVRRGVWDTFVKDLSIQYRCPFCKTIYVFIKRGHISPRKCKNCGAEMEVRQ